MSKRAEDFLDQWLDQNIFPVHQTAPTEAAALLTPKCVEAAEQAGVPPEELEEVTPDIAEAIKDELIVAKGSR